jgi:glycosyltransferase involved in cell wall biosynthesis
VENAPLVSIVVVTYNSAKYLQECLSSVCDQTYRNLQVIISDDGSSDETVLIARTWVVQNQKRFAGNAWLLACDKNTGITGNLNRGATQATGVYIKFLAGDDALLPGAIESLVEVLRKKNSRVCFSSVIALKPDRGLNKNLVLDFRRKNDFFRFFTLPVIRQYQLVLKNKAPHTLIVGSIFESRYLRELGFFDETYDMMEDYPLLVKLFDGEASPSATLCATVAYRLKGADARILNQHERRFSRHADNLARFRKGAVIPKMLEHRMYFSLFQLAIVMCVAYAERRGGVAIALAIQRLRRLVGFFLW